MTKAARRQHYIARFYLRNFAEPLFSENLCVYDLQKRRWERRTPDGIGWSPHHCSMIDLKGDRTDEFDQYLKQKVEDPAVPALKKLAKRESLDDDERSAFAFFIALSAARSPQMMKGMLTKHLAGLAESDREELDQLVKLWCELTGKPVGSKSHSEFLKPGTLGAVWLWSLSLRRRLLQWEWHWIYTTRENPFVTSDRPVFAEWDRDQDCRLVSFPVSSEIALIVFAGSDLNEARGTANQVAAMNRQTMHFAAEFIATCSETFPGDKFLP